MSLVFRGQSNSEWVLLPKAGRSEFVDSFSNTFSELEMFLSWKRYSVQFLTKEPVNEIEWYALAQHHGLATRLLDWTKNPLIATFFAVDSNQDKDATIFVFNLLKGHLANHDKINDLNPFEIDKDFITFFPKGSTPRIVNQRGLFTRSKNPHIPIEEIEKNRISRIIIDKKCKKNILESLRFYGIDRVSIFQDWDNLSYHLNDYMLNLKKKSLGLDLDLI